VANQTLTAGGDYTLLVWSDSSGTRTTLITDDNHEPSASTKTKIRLLNGMSGLGGPISLNVDFGPVVDNVALGTASPFSEVASGSETRLDINNAVTSQTLTTLTGVSLQESAVYTVFMSGNATTPGSTVRRDR
jgi:hypothetical protein